MSVAEQQWQMPGGLVIGDGTKYPISKVEGLALPEIRDSDVERELGHGDYPGKDLLRRRVIDITMGIVADNPADLDALSVALAAEFSPLAALGTIPFKRRGGPERFVLGRGRRLSQPSFDPDSALGLPDVVGQIVASDPLIYGATLHSSGPGSLSNGGTFPTEPIITVVGAATNPKITLAGQDIKTTVAVPGGQSLIIDVARRTVTLNGANRRDVVDTALTTWWSLLPGANTVTYTGGGTCTIAWRDTWAAI